MSRTVTCILSTAWAVLAVACSERDVPTDAAPSDRFAARAGWPAEVAARTVGDGVVSTVRRVRSGDGGELYALRLEEPSFRNIDGRAIRSFVTRHAPDGTELASFEVAGDLMLDFVTHPGGDITTLALRGVADGNDNIVVARRAPDGALRFEQALADVGTEQDRRAYTVLEDRVTSEQLAPRIEDGRSVVSDGFRFYFGRDYRLAQVGETLYLTAMTYGLRLFRLSEELVPVWSTTIMPLSDRAFTSSEPELAADGDGTLWATSLVDGDLARVHDAHFGTTLSPRPSGSAVLLSRFDAASGEPRGAAVIDTPAAEQAVGLRVTGGVATVVGRVRSRKADDANNTSEWDIFLARASMTETLDYRTIDVRREDYPRAAAFLDSGAIAVVGTYDFLQVDTNSWVENGSGFVTVLAADGTIVQTEALPGPRHVEIDACAVAGDTLYVGGHLDGFITHTCDGDPTGAMCHSRAFLGRLTLAPRALGPPRPRTVQ